MSLASRELGPEAMLLGSRLAPLEACRPGEYEVTFVVPPQTEAALNVAESAPVSGPQPWEKISRELADLRKHVERTAESVNRSQAISAGFASHPETAEYLSILLEAGLSMDVARTLIERVRGRLGRFANPWDRKSGFNVGIDRERFSTTIRGELESMIAIDSTLGKPGADQQVVALVGPPGSGKTSTLVKLAATYGLKTRRPIHILSLDTYRIAAAEQLRCYASILGVSFQVAETPRSVSQALEELKSKEMILIDTPGFGRAESDVARDLALVFSTNSNIDVHAVLPATMKPADVQRVSQLYAEIGARKLLFTRIDESVSLGSVVSEAIRAELPVSFLCDGQEIPEDLHEASAAGLLENLFLGAEAGAVAAA
jgi:flagellar biosynthesis protein FlhF